MPGARSRFALSDAPQGQVEEGRSAADRIAALAGAGDGSEELIDQGNARERRSRGCSHPASSGRKGPITEP